MPPNTIFKCLSTFSNRSLYTNNKSLKILNNSSINIVKRFIKTTDRRASHDTNKKNIYKISPLCLNFHP